MDSSDVEGTALFIDKVVAMWKILNVRSKNKDVRRNDPLVAVIESPQDPRLTYLLEMANMFANMEKSGKGKRSRQDRTGQRISVEPRNMESGINF